MAEGDGKYGELCQDALEKSQGECAILMIFHGNMGSGFSVTSRSMEIVHDLPKFLRDLAGKIEKDLKEKRSN